MPRVAKLTDLSGILGLYKELRPQDPILQLEKAKEAMSEIINSPYAEIVVADEGGKLVSTCMLCVVPSLAVGARPFGIIEHVITLPKARGKGFAKSVLLCALELAWGKGCYKVVLLSGEQRKEAHRLYESVGFVGGVEKGFVIKSSTI